MTAIVQALEVELRTIADFFVRSWEQLVSRTSGPMKLRFILQPATAAFLAVRAGLKDAREGRPPYLSSCLTDSLHRREILRTGWRDVAKIFAIALLLDSLYQIFVLREFHPIQALIVASMLALVPYLILRGVANRIRRRHSTSGAMPGRKAG
jgi:hypothetical protein